MLTRVISAILLACITLVSFSQDTSGPVWKPIFGASNQANGALFLESNSYRRFAPGSAKDHVSAIFLLKLPAAQQLEVEGDTYTIKSIVRRAFIDCNNGILAPVADFYFEVDMPGKEHKHVAVFEYENTPENYQQLSPVSAIYKSVCPSYI